MSYILDALRKADAERERGAVPDLHAQLLPPGSLPDEAEGAASPAWRWWGLGAGLIVLAGLGWLFLGGDAAPPPGGLPPPPVETATPTQALPPVPASAPASTAEVAATAAAPSASAGEPAAAAAALVLHSARGRSIAEGLEGRRPAKIVSFGWCRPRMWPTPPKKRIFEETLPPQTPPRTRPSYIRIG